MSSPLGKQLGFSTRAVHAGQEPDPVTGAVITPIYQTSTYVQEAVGVHKGYEYSRTHNRTREALEANLASLEGAAHGICFASGTAAVAAILHLLRSGDEVVCSENLYGGTYRLFSQVLADFDLRFTYVDATRTDAITAAVTPATRMLFLETPTNPLLRLTDLRAAAGLARERGIPLVVDNTFMTPYFQRPLELGATIVVHSTTKYLNGHSDMVGGIVVTSDDALAGRLRFIQNAVGAVPGPFDCWLALRGTKTLALRMRAHEESAGELARWLDGQAGSGPILRVHYPGLPSHPQHDLARRQMSGFGGIISLEMTDGQVGRRFLAALRIFSLAESLGGVESLASHPAEMTHATVPQERRQAMGLVDNLVRLSVGIEDPEDLRGDLAQALAAAGAGLRQPVTAGA
ncbi:MAG: PLP-dependent aspartate aminotransferase family protein [Gemmatimonadota bacterium]